MIQIHLNNQPHTIAENISLTAFFLTVKLDTLQGTAVAVNQTVIPKSTWDSTILQNHDHILLIKATQGG